MYLVCPWCMLVNVILILKYTQYASMVTAWKFGMFCLNYLWTHEHCIKTSLSKKLLKELKASNIKCANEKSVDRFPCSGFSYQYMNYIVEFFLFLKCWTDWYKKQSTKSKIYACVITGQISQSLSKTLANIAILCFQK